MCPRDFHAPIEPTGQPVLAASFVAPPMASINSGMEDIFVMLQNLAYRNISVKSQSDLQDKNMHIAMMERNERLKQARKARGFRSSKDAAERLGVPYGTYAGHEAGTRGIKDDEIARYASAFKVSVPWLAYGIDMAGRATVPLVGYVGAGAETHLFGNGQGPFDEVEAPEGSNEKTVAVEIRGESLGSFFDRWLVFYDDVRDPPSTNMIGDLCIVGTKDGRVLIKKLAKGSHRGLYTLLSQFESPIFDVEIAWAARVKNMVPR